MRIRETAALILALCSLLLGLVPWGQYLSIPYGIPSNLLSPGALSKSLLTILGGAVVALLLGRWERPPVQSTMLKALDGIFGPVRRAGLIFGGLVERIDVVLCQWPAAGICLLALTLLFGASMLTAA